MTLSFAHLLRRSSWQKPRCTWAIGHFVELVEALLWPIAKGWQFEQGCLIFLSACSLGSE